MIHGNLLYIFVMQISVPSLNIEYHFQDEGSILALHIQDGDDLEQYTASEQSTSHWCFLISYDK